MVSQKRHKISIFINSKRLVILAIHCQIHINTTRSRVFTWKNNEKKLHHISTFQPSIHVTVLPILRQIYINGARQGHLSIRSSIWPSIHPFQYALTCRPPRLASNLSPGLHSTIDIYATPKTENHILKHFHATHIATYERVKFLKKTYITLTKVFCT